MEGVIFKEVFIFRGRFCFCIILWMRVFLNVGFGWFVCFFRFDFVEVLVWLDLNVCEVGEVERKN